jgi:hypothetical protein
VVEADLMTLMIYNIPVGLLWPTTLEKKFMGAMFLY